MNSPAMKYFMLSQFMLEEAAKLRISGVSKISHKVSFFRWGENYLEKKLWSSQECNIFSL